MGVKRWQVLITLDYYLLDLAPLTLPPIIVCLLKYLQWIFSSGLSLGWMNTILDCFSRMDMLWGECPSLFWSLFLCFFVIWHPPHIKKQVSHCQVCPLACSALTLVMEMPNEWEKQWDCWSRGLIFLFIFLLCLLCCLEASLKINQRARHTKIIKVLQINSHSSTSDKKIDF